VCVCGFCPSQLASRAQCGVSELCEVLRLRTRGKHSPLPQEEGMKEEEGAGPSPPTVTFSSERPKIFWQRFSSDSLTQTLSLSLVSIFLCIFLFFSVQRRKQSPCCYLSIVVSQCLHLLLFISCHVFLAVDFH